MNTELTLRLDDLFPLHFDAGQALFDACSAELFPCDTLGLVVLERSLNLIKGFRSVVENGGYSSAVGLLRMQLDNILRFNGVVSTRNPHSVANQVLSGARLSKIKDRTGAAMHDKRLVELLLPKNPWIGEIYEVASGFVHLSREHFLAYQSRCPVDEDGRRIFSIGEEEDHIGVEYKGRLVEGFDLVSRGVPKLVQEWVKVREYAGTQAELKRVFSRQP